MDKIKGYLIIPVWLLLSLGTTAMLIFNMLISPLKAKHKYASPYFAVRSICEVDNELK